MQRHVLTALLLSFVVAHLALARVTVSKGPSGAYCGDYFLGLVKGRVATTKVPNRFDITLDIFGGKTQCNGEQYTYNEKTRVIDIPGSTDPNNCLGRILAQFGLKLAATYAPERDNIKLDFSVAAITLSKCK